MGLLDKTRPRDRGAERGRRREVSGLRTVGSRRAPDAVRPYICRGVGGARGGVEGGRRRDWSAYAESRASERRVGVKRALQQSHSAPHTESVCRSSEGNSERQQRQRRTGGGGGGG